VEGVIHPQGLAAQGWCIASEQMVRNDPSLNWVVGASRFSGMFAVGFREGK